LPTVSENKYPINLLIS